MHIINAKHRSNSKQVHNIKTTKHTDGTTANLQLKKDGEQTSGNASLCQDKQMNIIPLSNNANVSDGVISLNNRTYKHV